MTNQKMIAAEAGCPLILGANRMQGGMNFALEVPEEAEASLLLYRKKAKEPTTVIPFTEEHRSGDIYAMFFPDFKDEDYEYNFLIDGKVVHDPCAYSVRGREHFGAEIDEDIHKVRCGFLTKKKYDWENDKNPKLPYSDMILYKIHVRGYTKAAKGVTGTKGTFKALTGMIPYWQELGINAIELMPAYEFMEVKKNSENTGMVSRKCEKEKINYWGYDEGCYYAPKRSYCASKEPENEVRDFVKALHSAGMECIMEMYFPAGTNPFIALRALQFWKLFYHVDGFHLMGDGVPVTVILRDGVLSNTKIMLIGFDENMVKERKGNKCIAEYNSGFLQDMRRFLKSDEDMIPGVSWRVKRNHDKYAVINYMSFQDGFTLNDMVTYNYRHNEANGEENQDGCSYNFSWNCGFEGPSRKQNIRQIRERQIRNAFLMMLFSQGTPMIYGGDEIGNSQSGNNNAYCQDNAIGWIDWKGLKKNEKLLDFVKKAIAFRKEHPILHMEKELRGVDYKAKGFPDVSLHGERAWYCSAENTSRLLAVLYCGAYAEKEDGTEDDFLYVIYNFHWENREVALPNLPEGKTWEKVIDTADSSENGFLTESEENRDYKKKIEIGPRTIVVLRACKGE